MQVNTVAHGSNGVEEYVGSLVPCQRADETDAQRRTGSAGCCALRRNAGKTVVGNFQPHWIEPQPHELVPERRRRGDEQIDRLEDVPRMSKPPAHIARENRS